MTTAFKEWEASHPDVRILMSCDKYGKNLEVKMADISDSSILAERKISFNALPLDKDEVVLDDYICVVFEQLYQEIRNKRK